MSEKRRVFITVKTYPTISKKYDELVCTAGILDDGSWVRIYPLPFRKLEYENRYKKFQWLELPISKNTSDSRPESYKIDDIDQVKALDIIEAKKGGWAERKRIILEKNELFTDLTALIERAKYNELSLAIFKPAKITDFIVEEVAREWSQDKLDTLHKKAQQLSLFQTEEEVKQEFSVVRKLPYKFSYRFEDAKGRKSKMMIEDWELGMLYWNCLEQCDGDEERAIEKVRQKYFDFFLTRDIYLFLGTTKQFHGWASNPFIIIGVFYPPVDNQQILL